MVPRVEMRPKLARKTFNHGSYPTLYKELVSIYRLTPEFDSNGACSHKQDVFHPAR
jgi:hypothetical protein